MNSKMEDAGVHPGVLSWMRSIKAMPDGKRGFHLFLLRRYVDILEDELRDPTFVEPGAESMEVPAEAAVPFEERRRAAA